MTHTFRIVVIVAMVDIRKESAAAMAERCGIQYGIFDDVTMGRTKRAPASIQKKP